VRLEAFDRAAVRSVRGGLGRRIDVGSQDAVARVERLQATVASYSGHLRHGHAWRAWARVWEAHRWLGALFAQRGWRVDARWPLSRIARGRRFREQYWQLVRRAGPGCLVFCQVGRFVEFRGPQRLLAAPALGLRTTYLPRAGYGLAVGFPVRPCRRYEERALGRGLMVAVVRESGQGASRCRRRRPVALLVPGRSNSGRWPDPCPRATANDRSTCIMAPASLG